MRASRELAVVLGAMSTEAVLTILIGFLNIAVSAAAIVIKIWRHDNSNDDDDG